MRNLRDELTLELHGGSLQDTSGQGNDATNNGADLTTDELGRRNRAFDFTASESDYFDLGDVLDLGVGDFTISSCLRLNDVTSLQTLISKHDSGFTDTAGWAIGIGANDVYFFRHDGGAGTKTQRTDAVINTIGELYNIVITSIYGSSVKIYVNAVEATYSLTYSAWTDLDNTRDFQIGIQDSSIRPIDGVVGKTTAWDRALSDEEVSQHYQDIKGNYQGLMGGDDTYDSSGTAVNLIFDDLIGWGDFSGGNGVPSIVDGACELNGGDTYDASNSADIGKVLSSSGAENVVVTFDLKHSNLGDQTDALDDFYWIFTYAAGYAIQARIQNNKVIVRHTDNTWAEFSAPIPASDSYKYTVHIKNAVSSPSTSVCDVYVGKYKVVSNAVCARVNADTVGSMGLVQYSRDNTPTYIKRTTTIARILIGDGLVKGPLVCGHDFRGDALDFSGNGNDGVVTGAILASDRFGVTDNAYEFGNGDRIVIPNTGGLDITGTDITIIAVVKLTSVPNVAPMILTCALDGGSGSGDKIQFSVLSTDEIGFYISDGTSWAGLATTNSPISLNDYHVVIVTQNSSGKSIYIAGELNTSDGVATVMASNPSRAWVIGNESGFAFNWAGPIDYIDVLNECITAERAKIVSDLLMKKDLHPYIRGGAR